MKFLTLDDLYDILKDRKRSFNYDADKTGKYLLVHSLGSGTFTEDNTEMGLTQVNLDACHTETNKNKSYISYDVMKDKLVPTFKNRPILGYIHDVDGEPHFYTHNAHLDENDNIVYDEIAVGVVPESNNARLEYDENNNNYRVLLDGYIYDDYTKAADIIKREGECNVSVEIAVSKMSFDAHDKILNIEDGYFSGITILGKDEDGNVIQPGMDGANITLKDFEVTSSELDVEFSEKLIDKLSEAIDKIENAVATLNENVEGGVEIMNRVLTNGNMSYELSHDDIRCKLYRIMEDSNNWAYITAVYDSRFIYDGTDGLYAQNYTIADDTVSFDGDSYRVFAEFLTEDEKGQLDDMRNNYQTMLDRITSYEEEELKSARAAVFADEDYAEFINEPEFVEIKNNIDSYSVEDLRTACDLAYATCGKRKNKNCSETKTFEEEHEETPVSTGVFFGCNNNNTNEGTSAFFEGLLKCADV